MSPMSRASADAPDSAPFAAPCEEVATKTRLGRAQWLRRIARALWRVANDVPGVVRYDHLDHRLSRAIRMRDAERAMTALAAGASPFRLDLVPWAEACAWVGMAAPEKIGQGHGNHGNPVSLVATAVMRWHAVGMPEELIHALTESMVAHTPIRVRPREAFASIGPLCVSGEGRHLVIHALRRGMRIAATSAEALRLVHQLIEDAADPWSRQGSRDGQASCVQLADTLLAHEPFVQALLGASAPDRAHAVFQALQCDPALADALAARTICATNLRQVLDFATVHVLSDAGWQPASRERPTSAQHAMPRTWARLEQAELRAIVERASTDENETASPSSIVSEATAREAKPRRTGRL
ncbi:hypothetical protein [Burkholderia pseudomallei]|uniref:hypothetical protein n=1 Tax=Burkholderia pseudomallei TaxID=28450 RepID=UPI000F08C360|nr:hypothetical protein [Burkholderia pseudomallei]CAJ3077840.1 Uncharacterised protein [Burkholderia pseudomallei]VCK72417.1 Uncharacterised protein [Burkholderia pseudomallei]VCK79812.1 Uncharacterised protein [Burkholderia pseudomallei]VCK80193.1 Uncharacterised protein [Burkholderia pseudomallei]VCK80629.1 Uncharacterised protein [Burkholderia pseudomallei]